VRRRPRPTACPSPPPSILLHVMRPLTRGRWVQAARLTRAVVMQEDAGGGAATSQVPTMRHSAVPSGGGTVGSSGLVVVRSLYQRACATPGEASPRCVHMQPPAPPPCPLIPISITRCAVGSVVVWRVHCARRDWRACSSTGRGLRGVKMREDGSRRAQCVAHADCGSTKRVWAAAEASGLRRGYGGKHETGRRVGAVANVSVCAVRWRARHAMPHAPRVRQMGCSGRWDGATHC
jgi:hypothetical protein